MQKAIKTMMFKFPLILEKQRKNQKKHYHAELKSFLFVKQIKHVRVVYAKQ